MTADFVARGPGAGLRQRTTRAGPTESSVEPTVNTETIDSFKLLLWDDLPSWRRDNAFILSGYRRANPSYTHTFLSLTHLHNESVNIWTHLIGVAAAAAASLYLYFLVQPRYHSANQGDLLVFGCFFGGALLCLGMSATFHALLSHSEDVARWGNKLDYSGIVALIVGSYMPALYYGFFCRPHLLRFYAGLVRPPSSRRCPEWYADLYECRYVSWDQVAALSLGSTSSASLNGVRTGRLYSSALAFRVLFPSSTVPNLMAMTFLIRG